MGLEQKSDDVNERFNRLYDLYIENERRFLRTVIRGGLIVCTVFGFGAPVAANYYANHEVGLMARACDLDAEISRVRDNAFGDTFFYYAPADTMLTQTEFVSRATARRDSLVHEMYNPKAFFSDEFLAEVGIN
jgi:hypothetical protein